MGDRSNQDRRVSRIPMQGETIPLIIDTDAGTEVDDQYAITLALHSQDRLKIRGFTASHFRDIPGSIETVYAEINWLLDLCGMAEQ